MQALVELLTKVEDSHCTFLPRVTEVVAEIVEPPRFRVTSRMTFEPTGRAEIGLNDAFPR